MTYYTDKGGMNYDDWLEGKYDKWPGSPYDPKLSLDYEEEEQEQKDPIFVEDDE